MLAGMSSIWEVSIIDDVNNNHQLNEVLILIARRKIGSIPNHCTTELTP